MITLEQSRRGSRSARRIEIIRLHAATARTISAPASSRSGTIARGLPRAARINAASANVQGVSVPVRARLNVGDVNIQGRFDQGHSRFVCNAGEINVTLARGSDVLLRVAPYARWQVHTSLPVTDRGEWVPGSGSALLEIDGNFGNINVTAG